MNLFIILGLIGMITCIIIEINDSGISKNVFLAGGAGVILGFLLSLVIAIIIALFSNIVYEYNNSLTIDLTTIQTQNNKDYYLNIESINNDLKATYKVNKNGNISKTMKSLKDISLVDDNLNQIKVKEPKFKNNIVSWLLGKPPTDNITEIHVLNENISIGEKRRYVKGVE